MADTTTPPAELVVIRPLIPITTEVTLDAEGEPWHGAKPIVRLNPPLKTIADMVSGNLDRRIEAVAHIIVSWGGVLNEDGEPMPVGMDGAVQVTAELNDALGQAWGTAYQEHRAKMAERKPAANGTKPAP